MKKRKAWKFAEPKHPKAKLSPLKMDEIQNLCQPLVEQFKKQYIKENPDKRFTYSIDIYTKWNRNYLYFCEKNKSENPNRISDEYESKFVRLEYTGNDQFKLSYFRHTGPWFLVTANLTLNDCLEMVRDIPNFHPIG